MRRAAQFAVVVTLATLAPSGVGAAPMAMQSRVRLLVDEAHCRAAESWQQLQAAPDELGRIAGDLSAAWQSGEALRAITYALILLLVGSGVEWLAPLEAGGVALFAISTIAVSAGFSWPVPV